MSVEVREEEGGKLLAIKLRGKLEKQDYEHFTPVVERLVKQHGRLRMLVDLVDFHGWTLGALWEDMKFDWKHFGDIERLALVGDSKWEEGMAAFCKPFTKAKIHYFELTKMGEAHKWIKEGLA